LPQIAPTLAAFALALPVALLGLLRFKKTRKHKHAPALLYRASLGACSQACLYNLLWHLQERR